jgi:hypothetical protein
MRMPEDNVGALGLQAKERNTVIEPGVLAGRQVLLARDLIHESEQEVAILAGMITSMSRGICRLPNCMTLMTPPAATSSIDFRFSLRRSPRRRIARSMMAGNFASRICR